MRVLMLETPTALLEERARLGIDRWDEMWDGVLHVVPAPFTRHQQLGSALLALLHPIARANELEYLYETGLFRPGRDNDYRIPDHVISPVTAVSPRGIEGTAHAVIEIRSPGDESLEKIPWYLDMGVQEVIVIDRDTLTVEVFRALDPDTAQPVLAVDTIVTSLGVTLERVDDDHLAVIHPGGRRVDISL